ncbi:hypothetical protein Tco_0047163 [Tanacetum coccineum]
MSFIPMLLGLDAGQKVLDNSIEDACWIAKDLQNLSEAMKDANAKKSRDSSILATGQNTSSNPHLPLDSNLCATSRALVSYNKQFFCIASTQLSSAKAENFPWVSSLDKKQATSQKSFRDEQSLKKGG